ncbi:MAG: hypothetical protein COA66_01185 [Arcobacter sp.]|nr:MAG: hypothetical protein COA66_01185 [Arcobacter sp.]
MNPEVQKYILLADFLSNVIGENTEILIHDLTNFQTSIIHIINGHISNRKVGDGITNLILEYLKNESRDNIPFICNYNSKTVGDIVLYSSTFFIRDEKNEVVGAMCLNSDYSELEKSFSMISSFLPNFTKSFLINQDTEVKENLNNDSQQLTLDKIDSVIAKFRVTPERMTINEKTRVITELQKYGLFMIKGAVQEVASKLFMSEPSIYRYIKKIKRIETV